uniref:serine peptidase inhibitor, Kazal type 4 n=1 Tax=Monopterus albus TaxID=43700 RepID=UPI0009B43251|nr:probable pancreatic secretory proteinase inhibitor [Monopterus albus]
MHSEAPVTLSYSSTNIMTGRVVLLGLLFICVAADDMRKLELMRKPSCPDVAEILACPMNFAPLCGSDGNTYANECAMCVQRQVTKMDILIVKDGQCHQDD